MCLVAFFLLSLLFAELLWNFLSSPWPDHCWPLSLVKEKNTALVHIARFKTRELLPPSPLCTLVSKPLCFTGLSWAFQGSLQVVLLLSAVYHFFFLFVWFLVLSGPLPPRSPGFPYAHDLLISVTLWYLKSLHGVFSALSAF